MLITEISQRRKGITLVVADGQEFLLNSDTLYSSGISVGMNVERDVLLKLKKQSDEERAKSRALWYLSRGDHSKKALLEKLYRNFPQDASLKAVERMEELGLIDDLRYATNVASALSSANTSDREIVRKLFAKGVPSELAKQVVSELESDSSAQIRQLLEKKYSRRLIDEDGVRKVYAALIRKGFSHSDVRAALREYSENLDNCEE